MIWTDAFSDFVTGTAYFAIPIALAVLIPQRKDFGFRPIIWLFVSFILLCGAKRWLDLLALWVPIHVVKDFAEAIIAVVAVATAIILCKILPQALVRPLVEFGPEHENFRQGRNFLDRAGSLTGDGGWELEIATSPTSWSSETYRIHGVPLHYEPPLETVIGFCAPEAPPFIRVATEKCVADSLPWDLELPFDHIDGERVWVRSVETAISAYDQPIRLTGALQDATARVTARRALQEINDKRIELATDSGGIGIWDWDIEQNVMFWDAWMYRLYGLKPQDGVDTYDLWTRHLHPDDRAAAKQAVQDNIEGLKPYRVAFRMLWKDGSVHYICAPGRVARDASGRATRMIGTNWHMTETKSLATLLAAQSELLEVTLNSIGDGIITTNAQSEVTWLNPMAEKMTGCTAIEGLVTRSPTCSASPTRKPIPRRWSASNCNTWSTSSESACPETGKPVSKELRAPQPR